MKTRNASTITNMDELDESPTQLSLWKTRFVECGSWLLTMFGMYALWIVLHYAGAHLYIRWCVPPTMLGFILAPFVAPAPHCQGLRWLIYHGGNSIVAMWMLLGAWISKYLISIKWE
jgi:hypothetical protein